MKNLIKENIIFIIPYLSILLISSACVLFFNKTDIHIFINSHHKLFFDFFFKYWTWLGDGIFATVFTVVLLFIKYRWALTSAVSLIITSLTIQILKHTVYSGSLRPVLFFKENYKGNYQLHIIAGAEPAHFFSFPSGHTAAAFAIFFLSAVIVKNNFLKLIFLIIALLVGFSRIYLSWHFLGDTLAGSITGFIITAIRYLLIIRYKNNYLDKSLLKN
ncbi:MAG: phosphatase PAP2 family protein [Bacteroidales bacterium]|nr:phosphatase PAP2 family protein [Bacteroidales bacterium]